MNLKKFPALQQRIPKYAKKYKDYLNLEKENEELRTQVDAIKYQYNNLQERIAMILKKSLLTQCQKNQFFAGVPNQVCRYQENETPKN